jgi:hypothetical protein
MSSLKGISSKKEPSGTAHRVPFPTCVLAEFTGRAGRLWKVPSTGGKEELFSFSQECGIYAGWSPVNNRVACNAQNQSMLIADASTGTVLRKDPRRAGSIPGVESRWPARVLWPVGE